MQNAGVAQVDLRRLHLSLPDVGEVRTQHPHHVGRFERLEVAPRHVVGHAERARELRGVPRLSVVVREHRPEPLERRRGNRDPELRDIALQEGPYEVRSPPIAVRVRARQERPRKPPSQPEPIELVHADLVDREARRVRGRRCDRRGSPSLGGGVPGTRFQGRGTARASSVDRQGREARETTPVDAGSRRARRCRAGHEPELRVFQARHVGCSVRGRTASSGASVRPGTCARGSSCRPGGRRAGQPRDCARAVGAGSAAWRRRSITAETYHEKWITGVQYSWMFPEHGPRGAPGALEGGGGEQRVCAAAVSAHRDAHFRG